MDVADTNNAGPSIKVIQPKDMDTLYERNSFTIKWDSTGLDGEYDWAKMVGVQMARSQT